MPPLLLILGLLISIGSSQIVCSNKATLLNAAYDICSTDPVCMDSFYLTSTSEVWERPRFDYLLLSVVHKVNTNVTFVCSSELVFLEWLSVVKYWSFCRKNEVYSTSDKGCICVSGKNCDLTMNGSTGYTTRELEFLLVLVLFGGGYFWTNVLSKLTKLQMPVTVVEESKALVTAGETAISSKRKALFPNDQP